jgi:Raf kinase inhibitor-like YbhB/YbcL family protein
MPSRNGDKEDGMSELKGSLLAAIAVAALVLPGAAAAAALKVTVDGAAPGKAIPDQYAFCVPAPQGHVTFGANKNPKLSWSGAPKGTKSYAVIVVDPDVPSLPTNVNKEGKTIPTSLKRVPFYHWVLVDIPATVSAVDEGADSDKVTPHGKPPGPAPIGLRGINDYTKWFASDAAMQGNYGGYDGPCPPWNDTIVHHYHFKVYALDVPRLKLGGMIDGPQALAAMKSHTLAKGEAVVTYALNPGLMKTGAAK